MCVRVFGYGFMAGFVHEICIRYAYEYVHVCVCMCARARLCNHCICMCLVRVGEDRTGKGGGRVVLGLRVGFALC